MEANTRKRPTQRTSHLTAGLLATTLWVLAGNPIYAEDFSVVYSFANKADVSIDSPSQTVNAKIHRPGGTGLQSQTFTPEGWTAELGPSSEKNFCDAAIRIDLAPKSGYVLEVGEIEVHQRSSGPTPVSVRTYCTRNGIRPNLGDSRQSSPETALEAASGPTRFTPSIGVVEATGKAWASVYACASASADGSQWIVSKIVIRGTSQPKDMPENTVMVSSQRGQQMRFGIDAERLWWWYPGIDNELARYAVGELKVDYVRAAINCAYEREDGRKNPQAYDRILNMMKALKKENPDIKFFASPRPLEEAYTPQERDNDFGGRVPWSPFPLWVLPFEKTGEDEEGLSTWQIGDLDEEKYTRYIADYLNLMHQEKLAIDYLDTSNECNLPPEKIEYMATHLKELLDPGVKMPLIVASSAWNMAQGVEWVKSVNGDFIDVIASHNTDPGGSMEEFAKLGRDLGKEVWNSELHEWVGIDPTEEILTSEVLWKHIRAGFQGIDSWLFFGPIDGKDHTMVWTDGNNIRTSYKYEIFKQLVNNANRGFYLETAMPREDVYTTALVKDKTVSIWVLNTSNAPMENLGFTIQGTTLSNRKIEVTHWSPETKNTGETSTISAMKAFFTHSIEGESLYFFKVPLP